MKFFTVSKTDGFIEYFSEEKTSEFGGANKELYFMVEKNENLYLSLFSIVLAIYLSFPGASKNYKRMNRLPMDKENNYIDIIIPLEIVAIAHILFGVHEAKIGDFYLMSSIRLLPQELFPLPSMRDWYYIMYLLKNTSSCANNLRDYDMDRESMSDENVVVDMDYVGGFPCKTSVIKIDNIGEVFWVCGTITYDNIKTILFHNKSLQETGRPGRISRVKC